MTTNTLNARQRLFVAEYLTDMNAAGAAGRAGYRPASGAALLRRPAVARAVEAALAEREERTGISADMVIKQYARLAFFDIRKLYREDGALRDIRELDDDTAAAIVAVESVEQAGRGDRTPATVRKVKLADRRAALADLGKHLGLFKERLELSGSLDLARAIEDGRRRVAGQAEDARAPEGEWTPEDAWPGDACPGEGRA